jgi:SAM-dependent methyltransferase
VIKMTNIISNKYKSSKLNILVKKLSKSHRKLRKESTIYPKGSIEPDSAITLNIRSKNSIIHIGSLDSFDITEDGKDAARKILDYLETGNEKLLEKAIELYDRIIPNENFGGEYTALRWICKLFIAPKKESKNFLSHPLVASWFDVLAKDDFANLKEYLKRKYHFIETKKDDKEAFEKLRFLEDFILFNNPDRMRWDKTGENIYGLGLQKGYSIIDFGCGPGYFTFKFSDIVGEKGHVYGIETNEQHISFINDYIKKYNINNIDVFRYQPDGFGLKSSPKVDVVFMCSLYHILYAAFTDVERDLFIKNIKKYLKEEGRLIIVDNDLVESKELPYHGPYIFRDMIISQLWHYDFELIAQYQSTVQRYLLEFKAKPQKISNPPISMPAMFTDEKSANVIRVTSPSSLIRYRMIGASTEGYTLLGKKAAMLFYAALEKKDKDTVETALKEYEELIPQERIGCEYSAFVWFCKYLLTSKERQTQMLSNKFDAEYFQYLAADDFALLKKYVRIKYDLDMEDPELPKIDKEFLNKWIHEISYECSGDEVGFGFDKLNYWSEFINFNNPNRESWEKTSEMLNYLNIKDGEAVADIGCGFGFFSFKFSQLVGKNGKVYATETNNEVLEYVEKINSKFGLNIQTIQSRLNDVCLPPDSVDTIFMCSMYHAVYIASIEIVKDEFIASLKNALKKEGRLVIVDNAITPPDVVPYHGSGIVEELVISQLKYYGFRLVDSKQFIPQRYVLVFQVDNL